MASRDYCYWWHPLRVYELALEMCHLCLHKSGSHICAVYFKGYQGARDSGKKLQFARRKRIYFYAANYLQSISQLFPAQIEFQAFSVNCTETLFGGIFKTFQKIYFISKLSPDGKFGCSKHYFYTSLFFYSHLWQSKTERHKHIHFLLWPYGKKSRNNALCGKQSSKCCNKNTDVGLGKPPLSGFEI